MFFYLIAITQTFFVILVAKESFYGCTNKNVSDYFRQLVVEIHNQLRSSVALGLEPNKCGLLSAGANVYKLFYDCTLEESALTRASTCNVSHGQSFHLYGESIHLLPGININPEEAIVEVLLSWWSEAINYGVPEGNLFNISIYNWAQMAVGSNIGIGCATKQCSNFLLVTCHYTQNGHYLNSVVYTPGGPCKKDSDCTEHLHSKCVAGTGLCSSRKPKLRDLSNTICSSNKNMTDEARLEVLRWHNHLRFKSVAYTDGWWSVPKVRKYAKTFGCHMDSKSLI